MIFVLIIWLLWLFVLPPPCGVSGLTFSLPRLAGRPRMTATTTRMPGMRPRAADGGDRSALYMAARPAPPSFPFSSKLKVTATLTKLVSHGRATASRLSHPFQHLRRPLQHVLVVSAAATVLLLLLGVLPRLLLSNRRRRRQRRRAVETDEGIFGQGRMDEAELRLRAGSSTASRSHPPEVIARHPFRKREELSSSLRREDGSLERLQASKSRLQSFACAVRASTVEPLSTITTTTTTKEQPELALDILVRDVESLLSASSVYTKDVPTTSMTPATAPPSRRRFNFSNPFRSKYRSGQTEGYLEQLQRGSVEGLRSFADTRRPVTCEETPINLSVLVRDMENLLREASLSIEKTQQPTTTATTIAEKAPLPSNFHSPFQSSNYQSGRASSDTEYLGTLQGSVTRSGSPYIEGLKSSAARLSSFSQAARSTVLSESSTEPGLDLFILMKDLEYLVANAAGSTAAAIEGPPSSTVGETRGRETSKVLPTNVAPSNFYNPFNKAGVKPQSFGKGIYGNVYLEQLKSSIGALSSFVDAAGSANARTTDDEESVETILPLDTLVSESENLLKAAAAAAADAATPPVEEFPTATEGATQKMLTSYAPILADVKYQSAYSGTGSQYLESLNGSAWRLSSFADAARSTLPSESCEHVLDLSLLVRDLECLMENAAATHAENSPASAKPIKGGAEPETAQDTNGATTVPSGLYNHFKTSGAEPSVQSGVQNNGYLERLETSITTLSSFVDAFGGQADGPSSGLSKPVLQLERLVSDIETLSHAAAAATSKKVQQDLADKTMLDQPASCPTPIDAKLRTARSGSQYLDGFAQRRQVSRTQNMVCELLCRLLAILAFVVHLVVNAVPWLVKYAVSKRKFVHRWIPADAAHAARSTARFESANENALDLSVLVHGVENLSTNAALTEADMGDSQYVKSAPDAMSCKRPVNVQNSSNKVGVNLHSASLTCKSDTYLERLQSTVVALTSFADVLGNSSATASASSSGSDSTKAVLDLNILLADIEMLLEAALSPASVDTAPRNHPSSSSTTLPGVKNQSARPRSLNLEGLEQSVGRLKSFTEAARSTLASESSGEIVFDLFLLLKNIELLMKDASSSKAIEQRSQTLSSSNNDKNRSSRET